MKRHILQTSAKPSITRPGSLAGGGLGGWMPTGQRFAPSPRRKSQVRLSQSHTKPRGVRMKSRKRQPSVVSGSWPLSTSDGEKGSPREHSLGQLSGLFLREGAQGKMRSEPIRSRPLATKLARTFRVSFYRTWPIRVATIVVSANLKWLLSGLFADFYQEHPS